MKKTELTSLVFPVYGYWWQQFLIVGISYSLIKQIAGYLFACVKTAMY